MDIYYKSTSWKGKKRLGFVSYTQNSTLLLIGMSTGIFTDLKIQFICGKKMKMSIFLVLPCTTSQTITKNIYLQQLFSSLSSPQLSSPSQILYWCLHFPSPQFNCSGSQPEEERSVILYIPHIWLVAVCCLPCYRSDWCYCAISVRHKSTFLIASRDEKINRII